MPLNLIRKIIFANFDIHVCFFFLWYLLTGISLFLRTDICSLVTRHYSWTSCQALCLKYRWVGTPWDEKFCHVNKLTSVFHASVLLLIMNFIITLSFQVHVAVDPRGDWPSGSPHYSDNLTGLSCHVWQQDRTDLRIKNWRQFVFYDKKLSTLAYWRIPCPITYKFVYVRPLLTMKISQWASEQEFLQLLWKTKWSVFTVVLGEKFFMVSRKSSFSP